LIKDKNRLLVYFLEKINKIGKVRGVCGAVWFGFDAKSHPNLKIKKICGLIWFG